MKGDRGKRCKATGAPSRDGHAVAVYLPKRTKYNLKNTASGNTRFENTATYVSIDQDGDQEIADHESAAVNRPIRIRNSMYQVTSLDLNSITFQQIDVPLSGVVLNQKCPPFRYTSTSGEVITDKSILGMVTILDIWAVT